MEKYKLLENGGVLNQETGEHIPEVDGNRHWKKYLKWCDEGNIADSAFTLDELKYKKYTEIKQDFENSFNNGVEVVVSDVTYHMDAGEMSALKFKEGIMLAQELNETTIDIVDFNNEEINISIEDANQISVLVRKNYRINWKRKNSLRKQVKNATSEEEVNSISW